MFKVPVPVSVLPLGSFPRGLEMKKKTNTGGMNNSFFTRLEKVVALGKNSFIITVAKPRLKQLKWGLKGFLSVLDQNLQ